MKDRPNWLRTAILFLCVFLLFGLIFDIKDWTEILQKDIFTPEIRQEVFFDRLFRWMMWGILILAELVTVIVWNWPREKTYAISAVLATALCSAWAATALIPGFVKHTNPVWGLLMAALCIVMLFSWRDFRRHKTDEEPSS